MRAPRRLSLYGLLALALPLATAGCEAETAAASSALETSTRAATAERDHQPPVDLDRERRIKASAAGPVAIYRPVDRSSVAALPRLDLSLLRNDLRSLPEESGLPLLLPSDPDLLEAAILTTGDGWYSVSMARDDYAVSLNATRVVQRLPAPLAVPTQVPTRSEPRVTLNEATPVLTFDEGGVSWLLIVECASPHTDPRCTEEAFIRDLADGLSLVEEVTP